MEKQKIPTLKSVRLLLRPFKINDSDIVAELANDKEIATNTENLPYPYDIHMARQWIFSHQDLYDYDALLNLAIVIRKSNKLIGAIGLDINRQNNNAELGYWIGRPYWGHGYATEAAKRLVHFAFTELKLNRLHACHISQNPGSKRVLEKLNMTHEGHCPQHVKKWGEYLDIETYGLLAKDYKP